MFIQHFLHFCSQIFNYFYKFILLLTAAALSPGLKQQHHKHFFFWSIAAAAVCQVVHWTSLVHLMLLSKAATSTLLRHQMEVDSIGFSISGPCMLPPHLLDEKHCPAVHLLWLISLINEWPNQSYSFSNLAVPSADPFIVSSFTIRWWKHFFTCTDCCRKIIRVGNASGQNSLFIRLAKGKWMDVPALENLERFRAPNEMTIVMSTAAYMTDEARTKCQNILLKGYMLWI